MKDKLTTLWYRFRWNFLTGDEKKKLILSMARHPANAKAVAKAIDEYKSKNGKGWN
jgi:hypothetical protein